ncbi:hypothetical protein FCO61_22785 [Salmonella enterica]|nr:hypothetical protein [Salmonella enterica]EAT8359232.1 hypothetical protein [Salmonella enterica]EAV7275133.1 hypothetical protein [Salmonella enterica]EBB5529347.1 hypothetical protein [Salmonella enterica]
MTTTCHLNFQRVLPPYVGGSTLWKLRWWGWLRAGFTPEYSLELKKARPEGREILAMGCLQGAP